jgi:hypothetical protein
MNVSCTPRLRSSVSTVIQTATYWRVLGRRARARRKRQLACASSEEITSTRGSVSGAHCGSARRQNHGNVDNPATFARLLMMVSIHTMCTASRPGPRESPELTVVSSAPAKTDGATRNRRQTRLVPCLHRPMRPGGAPQITVRRCGDVGPTSWRPAPAR